MEWIKKYLSKKKPANECEPTQLTLENTRQATLLEFYPDLLGQKSLAEFAPDMIPMHDSLLVLSLIAYTHDIIHGRRIHPRTSLVDNPRNRM